MSPYEQQIRSVLDAAHVLTADKFSWFGTSSDGLTKKMKKTLGPAGVRENLVFELTQRLYTHFYAFGSAQSKLPTSANDAWKNRGFVECLSEANAGTGAWTPGFELVASDAEHGWVDKNGLTLRAPHDAYKIDASGVTVRLPAEQKRISPGFYLAQGNAPLGSPTIPILRIYFHLTPDGAVSVMRELTSRLNEIGVPFRFKVVDEPHRFQRRDGGVLYIYRKDFARSIDAVAATYEACCEDIRPGTVAFVRQIWPGVGLAEDPDNKTSFGMNRCEAVAKGLVTAYEQSLKDDLRLECVLSTVREAGVPWPTPHLVNAGDDPYVVPNVSKVAQRPIVKASRKSTCTPLTAATRFATRLAGAAIWHAGRCTWFGPQLPVEGADTANEDRCALDPTLYSGLAGVAWFMADAYRASNSETMKATAIAAARQALHRLDTHPVASLHGLYCGAPGVVLAAAYVASATGDAELTEEAKRSWFDLDLPTAGHFDVLAGQAGTILALLGLAELLSDRRFIDRAKEIGSALIQSAEYENGACSWRTTDIATNLCGYSHGTAGVAHALAELYAATGRAEFATAAEAAFAYEDKWFDAGTDNWPDLRSETPGDLVAWCHGATGIAGARKRVFEILGAEEHQIAADCGLRTTAKHLSAQVANGPQAGSCLCHGPLGQAMVLSLHGAADDTLAAAATQNAIERVMHDEAIYDPRLMLGHGGAAQYLLTAAGAGSDVMLIVPSKLVPRAKHAHPHPQAGQVAVCARA